MIYLYLDNSNKGYSLPLVEIQADSIGEADKIFDSLEAIPKKVAASPMVSCLITKKFSFEPFEGDLYEQYFPYNFCI